jgi:hypothetical protein
MWSSRGGRNHCRPILEGPQRRHWRHGEPLILWIFHWSQKASYSVEDQHKERTSPKIHTQTLDFQTYPFADLSKANHITKIPKPIFPNLEIQCADPNSPKHLPQIDRTPSPTKMF